MNDCWVYNTLEECKFKDTDVIRMVAYNYHILYCSNCNDCEVYNELINHE